MDNQKFNLILDKLLEKTEQEKLEWEKTADKNTFLTVLKDVAISISNEIEYFSQKGSWRGYRFDFRNDSGDIVETVIVNNQEDDSKDILETVYVHNQEEWDKAHKLFNLARNYSLNKVADQILEQLAA